jgi:hypothetical protein
MNANALKVVVLVLAAGSATIDRMRGEVEP